jgi:N-acyl-D-aspartate/D-glutamate deacylase
VLDEIIKGATVVDGTGAPGVVADVGIADGRIVAIGTIDEPAANVFDAGGLVVAPGFVDPHTHYDAQLLWDPTASPSSNHGVTTVVGGNCGFSLAPLHDRDADYLRRMMARVEGMPLPALEQGVDWKWESFGEFLDRFEGAIAVNAGFLVGHCAIRRYVMGKDAIGGEATPEQIAEMRAELGRSLEAGALGFSFTQSSSHSDGDGQPVASRWATPDELIAMSRPATTPAPRSRESCRAASTSSPTRRSSCSARSVRRPTARSTGTCSPSTPASPSACRASSRPVTARRSSAAVSSH